jgi:predicted nuclease of predicted toxin-antitoxin system
VKLLFDQNLSPALVALVVDLFPGSSHVHPLGLASAPDAKIREYAALNGFAVVSADNDFRRLAARYGPPPKVVFVVGGNRAPELVASQIRRNEAALRTFEFDDRALFTLRLAALGPQP